MGSILSLLLLLLVYAVVGTLSKAARKNMQGQKTPPRARQAEPAAAADARAPLAAEDSRLREIQPTIQVSEHDDSVYGGSLNAFTGEGYDPCHDEQMKPLTEVETIEPAPAAAAPGLQLNWTGEEIVRGLVISEILKRKGA